MLEGIDAVERRRAPKRGLRGTRVLVAHARGGWRRMARGALEPWGCSVVEVETGGDVIDAAWAVRPHVMLLDAALRRADGRPPLGQIRADPDLFGIAVVLVGDGETWPTGADALNGGAHDVLRADSPPVELAARVRAARDAHDLRELLLGRERALEELAYGDELTGLPNRRFVLRQLDVLISRARRHGRELAVLVVDADHFKALNDRYGHSGGDAALRALAARLRDRVRAEDLVGRFGGEEFVVALPDTNAAGAAAVAEDLRAAVAGQPVPVERRAATLTVSIGWADWRGEDLERLLRRADRALYEAKAAGRDRVRPAGTPPAAAGPSPSFARPSGASRADRPAGTAVTTDAGSDRPHTSVGAHRQPPPRTGSSPARRGVQLDLTVVEYLREIARTRRSSASAMPRTGSDPLPGAPGNGAA